MADNGGDFLKMKGGINLFCVLWVIALPVYAGDGAVGVDKTAFYGASHSQNFANCQDNFAGAYPVLAIDVHQTYPLCFTGFATLYSGSGKIALYSAHHLTKQEVIQARKLERIDSFHRDSRLPQAVAVDDSSYRGFEYDRGHLVPNGDSSSPDMQYDSFSFANIIPQNALHNRGVWRQIESHTRNLTYDNGEAYIVTGTAFFTPIFMKDVAVPTHLYKAVYLPNQNVAGVYFSPNDESGSYEVIDIQTLYDRTGVSIFADKSPTFTPSMFRLESTTDIAGEQSDSEQAFWAILMQVLASLWQKLVS